MGDEINDGGMSRKVNDLFNKKISPSLEARLTGDLKKDPLQNIIIRTQHMSIGIETMLESSLMLNSHTIETQMPELKEQFATNVGHLRDMIREGNSLAAQQKLEDVVKTFSAYKKVTASLFARLTNIISEFPKYSSELNDIVIELSDIRSELLDDKALVITESDYEKLALSLYNILVEKSKKGKESDNVKGADKSAEEIMNEKKTIADKLKGT